MSTYMREMIPLNSVLKEIGHNLKEILGDIGILHSTIYEDNNGELNLEKSPKMTPRSKHIGIKYHWFRDHIKEGSGYILERIESDRQRSDVFTKVLTEIAFKRIRKILMGW